MDSDPNDPLTPAHPEAGASPGAPAATPGPPLAPPSWEADPVPAMGPWTVQRLAADGPVEPGGPVPPAPRRKPAVAVPCSTRPGRSSASTRRPRPMLRASPSPSRSPWPRPSSRRRWRVNRSRRQRRGPAGQTSARSARSWSRHASAAMSSSRCQVASLDSASGLRSANASCACFSLRTTFAFGQS